MREGAGQKIKMAEVKQNNRTEKHLGRKFLETWSLRKKSTENSVVRKKYGMLTVRLENTFNPKTIENVPQKRLFCLRKQGFNIVLPRGEKVTSLDLMVSSSSPQRSQFLFQQT